MYGVERAEFIWALKLFMKSIGLAFVLWLVLMAISTLAFSTLKPVVSVSMTVVGPQMKRLGALERRVGLWMAIFALNTVAAVIASTLGALIILILMPLQFKDLKYRTERSTYGRIAKIADKVAYIPWRPIFFLFKRFDNSFVGAYQGEASGPPVHEGVWMFCGYSREDFRKMVHIFLHIMPALAAIVNGIIIGMLLAIVVSMAAYSGFLTAGLSGLFVRASLGLVVFLSLTLPHGVLELFAFLSAIGIGHSFARLYSRELSDRNLLTGDRPEELEEEVKHLGALTMRFLKSKAVSKTLMLIICLLFVAAYIEAYVTPHIAERILSAISWAGEHS